MNAPLSLSTGTDTGQRDAAAIFQSDLERFFIVGGFQIRITKSTFVIKRL